MRAAVFIAQILISVVVVAVAMPGVLKFLPDARDTALGPGLAVGGVVAVFVLLRLIWPRRRAS